MFTQLFTDYAVDRIRTIGASPPSLGTSPLTMAAQGQNCSAAFTSSEDHVLDVSGGVASVAGLLGSLAILLTILLVDRAGSGSTSMQALFWLSVCDVIQALIYLVSAMLQRDQLIPKEYLSSTGGCPSTNLCQTIGGIYQFVSLSALVWTLVMAASLHQHVGDRVSRQLSSASLYGLHVAAWLPSAAGVVVLASYNLLGFAGQVCWISYDGRRWWLVAYYVPLAMVFTYSVFVTFRMRSKVARLIEDLDVADDKSTLHRAQASLQRRMLLFIVVFITLGTLEIMNRIYTLASGGKTSFVLSLLSIIASPLQGLVRVPSTLCLVPPETLCPRQPSQCCQRHCACVREARGAQAGSTCPLSSSASRRASLPGRCDRLPLVVERATGLSRGRAPRFCTRLCHRRGHMLPPPATGFP